VVTWAGLDFTPVTQLVMALRAADLRADVEPANLAPPCVWVAVQSIDPLALDDSMQMQVACYLIVPDQDYDRAMTALAELAQKVATVLVPDGPVVPQGVLMPGNPHSPLPALRVPVNLI